FFFQAEDGIRDFHVTGVQTCALPISILKLLMKPPEARKRSRCTGPSLSKRVTDMPKVRLPPKPRTTADCPAGMPSTTNPEARVRSEERRVGKEGRSRRGG